MKEGLDSPPAQKSRKIACSRLAGLAGLRQNRYIGGNLWFSYDRVLRVGPSGPALFYYPNEPDEGKAGRDPGSPTRRI
jgi:hypothetical protein